MTNTTFICYKLIDDIVKRGGQQISDRYVVKACLNRVVLSNKKFITNQMIIQTGIKSQHCTIDNQLIPEVQPKNFKKDQYMSKSLQKYKDKKKINQTLQKRQVTSSYKIINKKKQPSVTVQNKNQKLIKKQQNSLFIEIEDRDNKPKYQITVQQQKINEKMRAYLLNKQSSLIKQKAQVQERQENRATQFKKAHNNFKKEIGNENNSDHTYDHDGKFIVYSLKNKQKCISNNFPVSLFSKLSGQQFLYKKKIKNPQQFKIKCENSSKNQLQIKISDKEKDKDKQFELTNKNFSQTKESAYNNNQKRQISSVTYFNAKPGICFTQPSSGQSVRGQTSTKSQYVFFKEKKSCFSKFFTSDSLSKTDGFVTYKNQSQSAKNYKKKSGISCKTEYYDKDQKAHFLATFSRRSKQSKQIGTIRDVNQNLLDQLIDYQ